MRKKLPRAVELAVIIGIIVYAAVVLYFRPPVATAPTSNPELNKLLDDPAQNISDLDHDFSKEGQE